MTCISSLGAHVVTTAYLLFLMGCAAQKVYFDCGAKVDVVDAQGLILSPGFPYNYSSGTHCVWQFFVPVDYQLILEIFDFDVFESHKSAAQYAVISNSKEDSGEDEVTVAPNRVALNDASTAERDLMDQKVAKNIQKPSQDREMEQVVVQEQSTKMELAKVSNSAKRSIDGSNGPTSALPASLPLAGAVSFGDRAFNTASSSRLKADIDPSSNPSTATVDATVASTQSSDTPAVSTETQQSVLDACPHDVLYISDLITFSSRFCGSNRPPSSQLVFGSNQEMVEVIMELITTTHWGRGFALLFHYNNLTKPGGERRSFTSTSTKADSLLAAVSGAAFFALILTTVICAIFRPKLCPKRDNSCASTSSEVAEGVQNPGEEVSELQPMAENQTNQEVVRGQERNKCSPPHTVSAGVDQNTQVDISSCDFPELELGPDEVFIISPFPSPAGPPFSPHTQRERFLRHSDTGPSPAGDWIAPDSSNLPSDSSSGNCSRPRAWSVRTFQEFLPPLPQLHKKWCSWNSTSPFTKLVDSAPSCLVADNNRKVLSDVHLAARMDSSAIISDSSISNASYPLTQATQRQRRLNSTSNLRRSRFTGPCFGLLSGTVDPTKIPGLNHAQNSQAEPISSASSTQCPIESGQAAKRHDFPGEGDHLSVPVFAISEEEDRQPLVSAEHLSQSADNTILDGLAPGTFEGKRPTNATPSLDPENQRARLEWKPWGSQVQGGVCPLPSSAPPTMTESNTINGCQLPLSQSAVLCSNHM